VKSIREAFEKKFGEDQAAKIMSAAQGHKNGVHDNEGSDPFKWAILICVGYECLGPYAKNHGITIPESEIKAWAYEHADLRSHNGDYDYLSAFCGAYDGWYNKNDAESEQAGA
jgi:hypothetical protein